MQTFGSSVHNGKSQSQNQNQLRMDVSSENFPRMSSAKSIAKIVKLL